ncbi:MAG: type VI secretion system ATPase TssH [Planctomycetes bacterium]|nr:type VI secretion system ATPase TssH [Planctomycetota bacterium]MCC7398642.1 type VI secretion system ATPase TssH [Planctomycetota bacterium]
MKLNLKSLIGRLTDTARRALEAAAGSCLSRTNYEVEAEHWLLRLVELEQGDVVRILQHFGLRRDTFAHAMEKVLGKLKTGNSRTPALSPDLETMLTDAWLHVSVNGSGQKVRSGALLLAALAERSLGRRLREACPELEKVNLDQLAAGLGQIVQGSAEDREVFAGAGGSAERDVPEGTGGSSATPALDQFTSNLTELARQGRLDPVLGRDAEIRQIMDILLRKRQNNPILTGEAGVGKTAVVEGFAGRIAAGDVPDALKNVDVRSLDLGLLQAGAGVKGEFENRLKQVIEEVRSSPKPIVLFIDEAHTLIGAGGAEGQNDAANLLKPALARGELRTVAATTWAEYKKYFEKDAALTRRFQVVKVDEPGESAAIAMMRGVARMLEKHHKVTIRDEAIADSVRLSMRYIPARQLPDKSVSLLDTACARIAIGQAATPAGVEDLTRRVSMLETELTLLQRETAVGHDHHKRVAECERQIEKARGELAALQQRWQAEKDHVAKVLALHTRLTSDEVLDAASRGKLVAELQAERGALAKLQGQTPLLHPEVTAQTVAEVVSAWTGVPLGRMVADEIQLIRDLPNRLATRVLGQFHAHQAIGSRIQISRARIDNPSRPIGVFLLVGPSGVGKTETALALAELLYGGERNAITINMSEYQEAHTVSSLKGSPPGYVGYGEGGVLTEAVRRRPYSVVLLDEVEKAHPDVMELFFQVFDKGMLEDGEGREIDFKNTVILLTSNVGSDITMKLCADPDTVPFPDALLEAIRPELRKVFPAALLGRMVTVPYYPILPDVLEKIVRMQLDRISRRVQQNHGVPLELDPGLVPAVVERCKDPESGARAVDRILTQGMLPSVANEILAAMADGRPLGAVKVGLSEQGTFVVKVS